jgi:apolipoprotein D and lipocalin family protein
MKKLALLLLLISKLSIAGELPPLKTVPYVDLNRYMGKWYEIASIPQSFQKDCVASSAQYSLRNDGKVDVLNQCRLKTLDGKLKQAKGVAWVTEPETNAKLKVSFFWPFWGKYWIVDLGADYEYAVVGHPDRDYLWILSRTPQMDEQTYEAILDRLKDQYYDVNLLHRTLQPSQSF